MDHCICVHFLSSWFFELFGFLFHLSGKRKVQACFRPSTQVRSAKEIRRLNAAVALSTFTQLYLFWCGSKLNYQGTAGFSPCVHLPKWVPIFARPFHLTLAI